MNVRQSAHTFSHSRRLTLGIAGTLLAVLVFMAAGSAEARSSFLRHLALESSVPAADANVGHRVEEVRLFFTEVPQAGTSIRIADAMDELVASSEAAADEEDPTQVFVRPETALVPGSYTIYWRAIAQDGHAANGEFGFQITTE
jgi:methionine-rich copper-binding protein CopC